MSNTEQQFGMGGFKDIMMDIIIDGQESHNKIAGQLLQDDRTFAIMQGMLAKMVFDGFKRQPCRLRPLDDDLRAP